jgi:hypothetical protein
VPLVFGSIVTADIVNGIVTVWIFLPCNWTLYLYIKLINFYSHENYDFGACHGKSILYSRLKINT